MELIQRRLRYNTNVSFRLFHLYYYFSKTDVRGDDVKLIRNFKNHEESSVRQLIVQVLESLQHHYIDPDLVIVRALHSTETTVGTDTEKSLDRLGKSIAVVYDCTYYPEIIRKKRITTSAKFLTKSQRKTEFDGVYLLDGNIFDFNHRKVLIIDDVVTTGATARAIVKAILDKFPLAEIEILCMAWTPTKKQQEYLRRQPNNSIFFNEPEIDYRTTTNDEWIDEDFENGETDVSVYAF